MEILQQIEDLILYRKFLKYFLNMIIFFVILSNEVGEKVICSILIIGQDNTLSGRIPNGMDLSFFHQTV